MKTKLLTLVLMLFLILGLATTVNATEVVEAQITYVLNDTQDGYIVSECINRTEVVNLVIPEIYENLPVTEIGDNLFYSWKNDIILESVTLPNTITKIGTSAFSCAHHLKTINLPNSIIEIGDNAFWSCDSLTEIVFPNNLQKIGNYAFGCTSKLNEVIIPDSVVTIGESVFSESGITSLVVGNGIKIISKEAFKSCYNLKNLELKAVEEIGDYAFAGDYELLKIDFPDTLKKIGTQAFRECFGGKDKWNINTIDESTLPSLVIPETVTYIGDECFNSAYIKNIQLPSNLEYLGEYVFLAAYIGKVEIPASIKVLPAGTFCATKKIGEITFKGTITEIGNQCFDCSNLSSIELPEELIKIGDLAFRQSSLTEIKIPSTVEYIGNLAFDEISGLTSIEIPESVTYIGEQAFLGGVYNPNNNLENVTINSNISRIEYATFANQTSLKSITLPETIDFIDGSVFANCISLSEIKIPSKVTILSSDLFTNCINLKTVSLPDGLTTINSGAFNQCTSLKSIIIPESVTSIDASAFTNCDNLTTIYGTKGSVAETFAKENNLKFVEANITVVETEEVKNEEGELVTVMPITQDNKIEDFVSTENFPGLVDGTNEAVIRDADGNVKSASDGIGSKNVIQIVDKATGEVVAEYTVVVKGDITGEGKARIFDAYEILKDSIWKSATDYPEIDIMIRDYDGDGKVRIFDAYSYLRDSIL